MRISTAIALGVAVAAFASLGRKDIAAQTGFNWTDWSGEALRALKISDAAVQDLSTVQSNPILFRSYVGKDKLTAKEARALISELDAAYFGNWFESNGVADDIVAVWKVESRLKPRAINAKDPMGGAWGIGQVLAEVARIDYGIASPYQLLDVETGARVSMAHIKSTIERLKAAGVTPTKSAWVQAYNVGVAGYVSGRRARGYLALVNLPYIF